MPIIIDMELERKEKEKKAGQIVGSVIDYCKGEYWEMTSAFLQLKPEPLYLEIRRVVEVRGSRFFHGFSTNGEKLYFDPEYILAQQERGNVGYRTLVEDLLHVVFHLLMGDPFEKGKTDDAEKLFDAYVDLRAEMLVHTMTGKKPAKGREAVADYLEGIKAFPESFSRLRRSRKQCREILELKDPLCRDNHVQWLEKALLDQLAQTWKQIAKQILGTDGMENGTAETGKDREADTYIKLEGLSRQIGQEKSTSASSKNGTGSGSLIQAMNPAKKTETDYREILRTFLENAESVKENPDTIDRIMYAYGMEFYENIALLEPGEDETYRKLDFLAIAIDTSGSCDGDVARRFLRETSNLIRDIGISGAEGRVAIYQCDDKIQDVKIYEDLQQLPDMTKNCELKGFGGTSFVPVFEDLESRKRQGQMISGLIYLTDGIGEYPVEKPDYPVLFLMEKIPNERLPEWVKTVEFRSV